MDKNSTIGTGAFLGVIIGGGGTFLGIAPKLSAVLMTPLIWLTKGWRPYPSESVANLIIALPLMFVYWGCFGALVAPLLCALFRRSPTENPPPENKS